MGVGDTATMLPPTEEVNENTLALDGLDAVEFIRALRAVDAQIFSGWRHHVALFDPLVLRAVEQAAQAAAAALRCGGVVVASGCGTSGRVAFFTARRYNALLNTEAFRYLHAGGDSALLLSDELPEDDAHTGAAELEAVSAGMPAAMLLGVTCGLSAAYVAGQLDLALASPPLSLQPGGEGGRGGCAYAASAIGFNPVEHARASPIGGWSGGGGRTGARCFLDVARSLSASAEPAYGLINPVLGPEAVAGSSRMKGGTAGMLLLDAVCYHAARLFSSAHGWQRRASPGCADAPGASDASDTSDISRYLATGAHAVLTTYADPAALASVCELFGAASRRGGKLYYVGEGAAGVLGFIDASEMPDTYGVAFDTLRAFVGGGWSDARNAEGDISSRSPLHRISLADFEADCLPRVGRDDALLLLGLGWSGGGEGGEGGEGDGRGGDAAARDGVGQGDGGI